MALKELSRHTFVTAMLDDNSRLYLTDRLSFGYRDLPDNRLYSVKDGDNLFVIAGKMFIPLPRPAGLWWVIADFQPTPVHDPTLLMPAGTVLIVPSIRTVQEQLFNENRRLESANG